MKAFYLQCLQKLLLLVGFLTAVRCGIKKDPVSNKISPAQLHEEWLDTDKKTNKNKKKAQSDD